MPDNNLFTDNLKSTQNMLAASQLLIEIKAVVRHKNWCLIRMKIIFSVNLDK